MEVKKNPDADINKSSLSLAFVGLAFALAIMLVSFEWTSFDYKVMDLGSMIEENLEEEEIPISIQQNQPPPPPPPAPTTQIEIVDDEEEIEEEEIVFEEVTEDTEVVEFEEVEEVEEEEIFHVVEDPPSFPGGDAELFKYLGQSLKYPQMAKDAGISGVVYVQFVVDKSGKVGDVQVLRGIGGGCDEEAIRVVKKMPKWKAGKQRGRAVSVYFKLPIRFTLR